MRFSELANQLASEVPLNLAEDWDNVGWIVGPDDQELTGILTCVDLTPAALEAALENNCNFLLAHHPLIFSPLQQVIESSPQGAMIFKAIQNSLGIYALHTNADLCLGGLNDLFGEYLGLFDLVSLVPRENNSEIGMGRIGEFDQPVKMKSVENKLKSRKQITYLRSVGDATEKIERVAFCTGSGGDFIKTAVDRSVDLYVSADLSHHEIEDARLEGLNLIILDHREMETFFLEFARRLLEEKLELEHNIMYFERESPYRHSVKLENLSSWEEQ